MMKMMAKLEFPEGCLPWKGNLINVVDKLLKRYHDQNLPIQEFLLDVTVQSDIHWYLEKWISLLISLRGLNMLNLKFVSSVSYDLPSVVFLTESLQELNLTNCGLNKISSTQNIMFKNLQTLRLCNVSIEEETLENIMSSCPLIQSLVIHKCKGLRTIKVSNAHNLKNFDFVVHRQYPGEHEMVCPSIEIEAPTTLQSIRIRDWNSDWVYTHTWICHHNNNFFLNLKSVYMYMVRLPKESFDIFSSHNCPCLEDLELSYCHGFKGIEISSRSIKRLVLMNLYNWSSINAAIDTPNIVFFKSSFGNDVPSLAFTKTSGCEWKSDISMRCRGDVSSTQLLKLKVLLKALCQSQISLDIDFSNIRNQHFEDSYEGFNEPVVVEHLSLSGSFPSSFFPDFLNYLFLNICRPRYVNDSQIKWENIQGHGGIGRESLCKVVIHEIEKMDCLWQKDLEDISIGELKYTDEDDGEELSWLHFLDSRFRLRLKWKEFSWLE